MPKKGTGFRFGPPKVEIENFPCYEIIAGGTVYSLNQRMEEFGASGEIQTRIDRGGYRAVRLFNNGKMYTRRLHRLLAEHFIPNPLNLPIVNHKNANKHDNTLSNLEWTTHAHNIKHAYELRLIKRKQKCVTDEQTGIVYKSAREAATQNGIPYSTIKGYLNGTRNNKTTLRYIEN